MNNSIRKIGLDPGFGGLKVAEVQGDQIVSQHLPSVVGVGTTDAGALSLVGVVRGRRIGDRPHVVAHAPLRTGLCPLISAPRVGVHRGEQ